MSPTSPDDTIAAVSTPPGEGGIGIVRVSGAEAIPIVARLFVSATAKDIAAGERQVYYGEIRDGEDPIDEVLVHVMRAPHTYTREDIVEINAHGGAAPLNAVLELVLRNGARLAGPGEFTRRAFLNGRIDLVQAEAVIDRIRAKTRAGLQSASAAARGALSKSIHQIRAELLSAKAHVEAAIDFPDQDLPQLITPELRRHLGSARDRMQALYETADAGRLLREGVSMAISGRPNVGKSSLFNALLRDSRAIVTPSLGTTRDVLQEVINLDGIPVKLADTAGLRETEDEVEKIGVQVARRALAEASLVLFVVDASEPRHPQDLRLLDEVRDLGTPVALVQNKIDLRTASDSIDFPGDFAIRAHLSALTGQGLADLERDLAAFLHGSAPIEPDQALITRLRQKESLRHALLAVDRVQDTFHQSPEFIAIELDEALRALSEITGETTPDEVLEQIFSTFCIGK